LNIVCPVFKCFSSGNQSRFTNQAKADYNASAWTLFGEAGARYALGEGLRLEPSLGLQATRYQQDRYTESGAPGANLAVAGKSVDSLLSTLGLRVAREIREGDQPRGEVGVSAAWKHEFGTLDNSITAAFAAAPGAGDFTASGARRTRDALQLGAGASIRASRKTQWFADYSATFRQEQTTQLLMAGVRAGF